MQRCQTASIAATITIHHGMFLLDQKWAEIEHKSDFKLFVKVRVSVGIKRCPFIVEINDHRGPEQR